jgi:hypothetical protein
MYILWLIRKKFIFSLYIRLNKHIFIKLYININFNEYHCTLIQSEVLKCMIELIHTFMSMNKYIKTAIVINLKLNELQVQK